MSVRAFRSVFSKKSYVLLAVGVAFLVFSLVVLFPNTFLISEVLKSAQFSLGTKLVIIGSLYGSIATNFTLFSAVLVISTAVLFGMNIALMVYLVRRKSVSGGGSSLALGGLISGLLGVGCAACGSLIVVGVLPFVGSAAVLAFLPFGGEEFAVLGVLILAWSTHLLLRRVHPVCPI